MEDDIDQVKSQATTIINTLAGMTSDFRIGIVGFRDFGDDPIFEDFPFTADIPNILSNIQALSVYGGGDTPEAIYEALMRAMDNVTLGKWRSGVGKILILMGDAPPHERGDTAEDGSQPYLYTVTDMATRAQNLDPAHVYPITVGISGDVDPAVTESYKQIATLTGGQMFSANEADKVPQVISDAISTAVTDVSRTYPDIPGNWAQTEIEKLTEIGLLRGFPDGYFRPEENVTRAQFAKIMTIALRIPEVKPASPTFPDATSAHWAYGYIEAAVKRGLLKGFPDGSFKPEDPVSKAQVAAIIARENNWTATPASPTFSDIPSTHWAYTYLEGDFTKGVLKKPDSHILASDSAFGEGSATRSQACVLVYRMLQVTGSTPSAPTPTSTPPW
jgi:hypothetical protein